MPRVSSRSDSTAFVARSTHSSIVSAGAPLVAACATSARRVCIVGSTRTAIEDSRRRRSVSTAPMMRLREAASSRV